MQLTMPELYETLSTGGTFKLRFNSHEEANNFRATLATHKHRVEKELILVGHLEPQSLTMTYDKDSGIASFSLKERVAAARRTYEIISSDSPTPP